MCCFFRFSEAMYCGLVSTLVCLIGACLYCELLHNFYPVCSLVFILGISMGIYYRRRTLSPSQGGVHHRFDSFAPVREGGGRVKWYVDGEDYMSAVADAIFAADKEIFITDLQLNPHIFLKRPKKGVDSLEWRLDKLLLQKAEKGVHIYILLYWEVKYFLGREVLNTGSQYVKKMLSHKNITVIRHPDYSSLAKNPEHIRWSHHEKIVVVDRSMAFVGGIDLAFGRWDTHEHPLVDNFDIHPCVQEGERSEEVPRQTRSKKYQRFIGKDYGNTFVGGNRTGFDEPFKDYIDRSKVPRMPWHDVACGFTGPAVGDVAKHFIQRYNFLNKCWHTWIFRGCPKLLQENIKLNSSYKLPDPSSNNASIQVIRSIGDWSGGQPTEDSIHKAYVEAIKNSKHFIYIENQFFISSQPHGKYTRVLNKIQAAICNRILRAYKYKKDFHVFIVLPLEPEIAGDWETNSEKFKVSCWNYASLYNGEDSLMYKLKEKLPPDAISRYLSVYGLRTHSILNGEAVTEIIYVHSKMMIVDDRVAIIGSANINDRSMLGYRDSEVDVIIEDREMIAGAMNGKQYPVGKFSHELRCHLFREHLGLPIKGKVDANIDPGDPLRIKFISKLRQVASSNTNIYEKMFGLKILPNNRVQNYEDLNKGLTSTRLDEDDAKTKLNTISGNIVEFPALFLKKELKSCPSDYLNIRSYKDSSIYRSSDNVLLNEYGFSTHPQKRTRTYVGLEKHSHEDFKTSKVFKY